MDKEKILSAVKLLIDKVKTQQVSPVEFETTAKELLRLYAGENSSFYLEIKAFELRFADGWTDAVISILLAFINLLENDLLEGISLERQAQIDVVSDFLSQAQLLLNSKKYHPATPCTIIGAALEEFLRNWIEEKDLGKNIKPGLNAYATALQVEKLITVQDGKDITSWAGLRNSAAHGEWEEVEDRQRITMMLEGVNLFMRKYGE